MHINHLYLLIFTVELLKIKYSSSVKIFSIFSLLHSGTPDVLDLSSLIINHGVPRSKIDRKPETLLLHLNKQGNFRAEVKKDYDRVKV